ncbi:MAG TPA: hypothetical protein VM487_22660 [Phycisphaerae bacterium]|nr:hypothetical protein [Phycisphaerae bacterium]
MPHEEEILKYTLDVSDVEAKAARLNELLDQIKAKRAAKEDTSALEAQVGKELDGLGKLAEKEMETAGATEELTKQKQKLTAVARLLGGEFSGAVRDIGGMVELLMTMGPVAAGAAAALAGISVATAAYQKFREELEKAIEKQKELNEAVSAGKLGEMAALTGLRDELEALGGLDRLGEAYGMMQRLGRKYGFEAGRGAEVAGVGVMAGLNVEETAIVSHAIRSSGAQVETPQQARQLIDMLKGDPEAYGRAVANLSEIKESPPGKLAQAIAEGRGIGIPEQSAAERALETLKDRGWLPAGIESADDLRSYIQGADEVRRKLKVRRTVEGLGERARLTSKFAGWLSGEELETLEALEEQARAHGRASAVYEREVAREGGGMSVAVDPEWQPTASDGARPVQSVVNNFNDNRITAGTIYNTKDKRTRLGHPAHGRVDVGSSNFGRTNHGM